SDQSQPLSSYEWIDKHSIFLKLYNNNSPVKRNNAIEFIDTQIYNKLLISDIKYAVETMEFLLQVLSVEEDEAVAITTKELLAKFLIQPNYMEWMLQNYKKLVSHELTKSRFIDTLNITVKSSKNESIIKMLTDFTKEEKPFLRLSALDVLYRYFPVKSIDIMVDMVKDVDLDISRVALKCLSEVKPSVKTESLIKLLGEEKREEIKMGLGQILEKITGQKYKTDFNAWQKWWKKQPRTATINQSDIDDAIKKGTDFLIQNNSSGLITDARETELVFYTLIRSGAQIPEPIMNAFLNEMLNKKLENTYRVALMAMALSELDKIKYLERIVQCAEFLLANQLSNGGWGYDMKTPEKFINTGLPKPITSTETTSTKTVRKISIKMPPRRVSYGANEIVWDTSISQYAVLGLRACADADIDIPIKIWRDAEQSFSVRQFPDGSWNCHGDRPPTHSMTVGGMGSLAICLFYQNKDIQKDNRIKRAMNWLVKDFTITGSTEKWNHYYYIYGLERAGTLVGTEFFGQYYWYSLGVSYLLKEQRKDDSWNESDIDTCFAVLFLRRATKPLKIVITDGKDKE
ncbi:MAG: prenyltransferase/squalene oxidase repeat-containing protein, partial [Planctomycetota bacterium]